MELAGRQRERVWVMMVIDDRRKRHVQRLGPAAANWAIRRSTHRPRGQTLGWKLAQLSSVNEAEKEALAESESLLIVNSTGGRQSGPLMVVAGKT